MASGCPMCFGDEELIVHLFALSVDLCIGLNWVQPQTMREVLVAWRRKLKKSWIVVVWNLMSLTIWWNTWKEMNSQIFESKARSSRLQALVLGDFVLLESSSLSWYKVDFLGFCQYGYCRELEGIMLLCDSSFSTWV